MSATSSLGVRGVESSANRWLTAKRECGSETASCGHFDAMVARIKAQVGSGPASSSRECVPADIACGPKSLMVMSTGGL